MGSEALQIDAADAPENRHGIRFLSGDRLPNFEDAIADSIQNSNEQIFLARKVLVYGGLCYPRFTGDIGCARHAIVGTGKDLDRSVKNLQPAFFGRQADSCFAGHNGAVTVPKLRPSYLSWKQLDR